MMRLDETAEIFTVECYGCGRHFLSGTGTKADPLLDATYDGDKFICPSCFQVDEKRTYN